MTLCRYFNIFCTYLEKVVSKVSQMGSSLKMEIGSTSHSLSWIINAKSSRTSDLEILKAAFSYFLLSQWDESIISNS